MPTQKSVIGEVPYSTGDVAIDSPRVLRPILSTSTMNVVDLDWTLTWGRGVQRNRSNVLHTLDRTAPEIGELKDRLPSPLVVAAPTFRRRISISEVGASFLAVILFPLPPVGWVFVRHSPHLGRDGGNEHQSPRESDEEQFGDAEGDEVWDRSGVLVAVVGQEELNRRC